MTEISVVIRQWHNDTNFRQIYTTFAWKAAVLATTLGPPPRVHIVMFNLLGTFLATVFHFQCINHTRALTYVKYAVKQ